MSRENEARPSGRASVAVAESVTKVSGLEGADTQRRGYVQPKQLPALLKAAEGAAARARAAVAGRRSRAGLRIGECLELERRHVNLARGTLTVLRSKTEAGRRADSIRPSIAPRSNR